ncbi:MAG: hypothetical protein COX62_01300 [Deltaproteobacteria bacterium CG_4_10_14_0_2_um_filter_43_8]|nr:MAG: hypothetical protein COV43_09435 [Deltaproteobacteria bacterium CG11_big_fil_rev_8_21_14_0_20_42_23]PJA21848.1 MAG: hypothetical protein COX62_01300 [Deltaproteobacteria bacterium CG_4_10_14_0_2_um_filter_43_8]PJC64356.1 MAG: hypothetical protein CO021_04970 [Deltaproteobacteria bacterium CG_4_9_14_0_2_um_filter_42_21]
MLSAGEISICGQRYGDTSLAKDCEEYVKQCRKFAKDKAKSFVLVVKNGPKLFSATETLCLQHALLAPSLQKKEKPFKAAPDEKTKPSPKAPAPKAKDGKPTAKSSSAGKKDVFTFDDLGFTFPARSPQELTLVTKKDDKYFISKITVAIMRSSKGETSYTISSEKGVKIGEGPFTLSRKSESSFRFVVTSSPKNPSDILHVEIISK